MLIDSLTLDNIKIKEIISKSESSNYCVFIQPKVIIYPQKMTTELKFDGNEDALMSEELIMEIFEDKEESTLRLIDFNKWTDYFHVSLYKNGKLLGSSN